MTARIDTLYTCDGCGKTERSETNTSPSGWTNVHAYGGGIKGTEAHACSKPCVARVFRKLADVLDPPRERVTQSAGGPYR